MEKWWWGIIINDRKSKPISSRAVSSVEAGFRKNVFTHPSWMPAGQPHYSGWTSDPRCYTQNSQRPSDYSNWGPAPSSPRPAGHGWSYQYWPNGRPHLSSSCSDQYCYCPWRTWSGIIRVHAYIIVKCSKPNAWSLKPEVRHNDNLKVGRTEIFFGGWIIFCLPGWQIIFSPFAEGKKSFSMQAVGNLFSYHFISLFRLSGPDFFKKYIES